jgi:hypothetical protein
MSLRSLTHRHSPTVSMNARTYAKVTVRRAEFERFLSRTLTLFDRDPAAKAEFLARIPTRIVYVKAETAERAYDVKQKAHGNKRGSKSGMSLKVADDAINRALDREESRAAVRRALETKR